MSIKCIIDKNKEAKVYRTERIKCFIALMRVINICNPIKFIFASLSLSDAVHDNVNVSK